MIKRHFFLAAAAVLLGLMVVAVVLHMAWGARAGKRLCKRYAGQVVLRGS